MSRYFDQHDSVQYMMTEVLRSLDRIIELLKESRIERSIVSEESQTLREIEIEAREIATLDYWWIADLRNLLEKLDRVRI